MNVLVNNKQQIAEIYEQPLIKLISEAQQIHKQHFADDMELCQIISVKTGGCPEDCAYCSQSNHYQSGLKINPLLPVAEVEKIVIQAKANGANRICMGAGYKTPPASALKRVSEYISLIKKHGLETCVTLGSLTKEQALELKAAGLDYYNHNIDTSPEFYSKVIMTRTFQDRVDTIDNVGNAGIKVCCGGILGMGESREDRISFIYALTKLPFLPSSIPINTLVKIPGTRLANVEDLDKLELVRVIATVRHLLPNVRIRLSAGRLKLTDLEQTMCFMSGANSIFYGENLLTTANNHYNADQQLLDKLGINYNG
ncbi:MAG: bioB [Burkholderiales bacterium]|jgi:biotin synthase|nr:bioB [Burkholderiales bacterium]